MHSSLDSFNHLEAARMMVACPLTDPRPPSGGTRGRDEGTVPRRALSHALAMPELGLAGLSRRCYRSGGRSVDGPPPARSTATLTVRVAQARGGAGCATRDHVVAPDVVPTLASRRQIVSPADLAPCRAGTPRGDAKRMQAQARRGEPWRRSQPTAAFEAEPAAGCLAIPGERRVAGTDRAPQERALYQRRGGRR